MQSSKEIHDTLLKVKPDGVDHDVTSCSFCSPENVQIEHASTQTGGGAVSDKTYTEEDLKAKDDEVKNLQAELDQLKTSQAQENLKSEIAKATEAKDEEIKELQANLDTAVLEAQKAKDDFDALVAKIEDAKAEAEKAAEIAARRDERLSKVKEVASFPEEYLQANADRWAAMADEDFDVLVADYALVSKPKEDNEDKDEKIPASTAMQAAREEPKPGDRLSATRELLRASVQGVDFRSL